jgi:hypothetical protein
VGAGAITTADLEVSVLGTFRFWAEGSALPAVRGGSQRLLALLGLRDRALTRASVAGTLWPESSEDHAYSSLRSALGRLSRMTRDAVLVTPLDLCLADEVMVDIRQSRSLAHRLLDPATQLPEADLSSDAATALSVDVLPDWYDDWGCWSRPRSGASFASTPSKPLPIACSARSASVKRGALRSSRCEPNPYAKAPAPR